MEAKGDKTKVQRRGKLETKPKCQFQVGASCSSHGGTCPCDATDLQRQLCLLDGSTFTSCSSSSAALLPPPPSPPPPPPLHTLPLAGLFDQVYQLHDGLVALPKSLRILMQVIPGYSLQLMRVWEVRPQNCSYLTSNNHQARFLPTKTCH